jgi:hypothetical protein
MGRKADPQLKRNKASAIHIIPRQMKNIWQFLIRTFLMQSAALRSIEKQARQRIAGLLSIQVTGNHFNSSIAEL